MLHSEIIQQEVFPLLDSLYQAYYLRFLVSVLILGLFNFLFFKYLYKKSKGSFAFVLVILLDILCGGYYYYKINKMAVPSKVVFAEVIYPSDFLDSEVFYYWKINEKYQGFDKEEIISICTEDKRGIEYPNSYYLVLKASEISKQNAINEIVLDSIIGLTSKRGIEQREPVKSKRVITLEKEMEIKIKQLAYALKDSSLSQKSYIDSLNSLRNEFLPQLKLAYEETQTKVKENYRHIVFLQIDGKNIPLLVLRPNGKTIFYQADEDDLAHYFE